MKKNLKVVQINGFRGIFLTLFIVSCLIAGFIAFPAFLAMTTWNYLAFKTGSFPQINFIQGLLLWGIVAFGAFVFNKRRFIVSFNSQQELTDDEVKEVISRIKSQTLEKHVLVPKDFKINDNNDNIDETHVEQKDNN